jgi:hypothetical protein
MSRTAAKAHKSQFIAEACRGIAVLMVGLKRMSRSIPEIMRKLVATCAQALTGSAAAKARESQSIALVRQCVAEMTEDLKRLSELGREQGRHAQALSDYLRSAILSTKPTRPADRRETRLQALAPASPCRHPSRRFRPCVPASAQVPRRDLDGFSTAPTRWSAQR